MVNSIKALDLLPDKLKDDEARKKLAQKLSGIIDTYIDNRGDLGERIALNEKFVKNRNVKPAKVPWKGAQHFHIPLSGPRLNQRKANIVAALTSSDVYFRFSKMGTGGDGDNTERTVQFFLDLVNFKAVLDEAVEMAMTANQPIWRVTFQEHPDGFDGSSHTGKFAGLVFDIIHPNLFICYPARRDGIPTSLVCGHCFDERKGAVKQAIKRGEYLEAKLGGSDDTTSVQYGVTIDDTDTLQRDNKAPDLDDEDENLVIWDLLYAADLDENGYDELYRILMRKGNVPEILLAEPYEQPRHWYINMPIYSENGRFEAEESPAQDLQGLQILANSLVNEFVWGTQMNARPAVLTENWALNESMVGYEPGELRNTKALGKAMPIPAQFSSNGYDYLIALVRSLADSASKTSDALTGSPSNARESTATEQDIKYQAFQIGASDDITAMSKALRKVAVVSLELLIKNFDRWYPIYQDEVPVKTVDELSGHYIIKLSGESPSDSPAMQMQQSQMLIQLLSQIQQPTAPMIMLVKSIIKSTSLANKDDVLREIDKMFPQLAQGGNVEQPAGDGLAAMAAMLQNPGLSGSPEQMEGGGGGFDPNLLAAIGAGAGASGEGQDFDD